MSGRVPLTAVEYRIAIDYLGGVSGLPGTVTRRLGVVSEDDVLEAARLALEDAVVYRVQIFAREVPIQWTKIEEVRRDD